MIVALAGVVVGFRFHGHTSAEEVCRLADSEACAHYAERGELLVRAAEHRFHATQSAARREPPGQISHALRGLGTRPAEPNHPPLDRHTPEERHALDHVLNERGSR